MPDQKSGSITGWLPALQAGDDLAAQQLWETYYAQLIAVARNRLRDSPRRVFDEEDVVLSALNSFCDRAARNAFPQLNDRHDLWALLVTITARKVLHKKRHELSQKRGGGMRRVETGLASEDDRDSEIGPMNQIIGTEPTPEFAAEVAEQVELLLGRLNDESLSNIAISKMEGWSTTEIAEKLKISDRTVRRKLKVIATIWESNQ